MRLPFAPLALAAVVLLAPACTATRPAAPPPAPSQAAAGTAVPARVAYEIAFPNAVHHEAEVTVTFTGVPTGQPLQLRMSRTSPGRYALHEFAKNVYAVRVDDGRGRALPTTRPNLHQWDVAGHDGTVRVRYTLFGDLVDGTYAAIDQTHAHLNMPATFMWARGLEAAPITVRFARPDPAWRIATQLLPTDDPDTFTAPGLAYFMDSPTEVSPFTLRTWTVNDGARAQTIRLALHHTGTEAEADAYAEMARRVVAEQIAVFGALPTLEPGTYTFLADYLPYADGDGMEHRNSTVLTSARPLAGQALANLGTLSHEFFHLWNVERLRPRALEPFNFEEANVSGELWFAEGFTSYYDGLFIRRAGLFDDAHYAQDLTRIVDATVNAPGRRYFSPIEMSRQAPFVDAAKSVDPTNRGNTFLSYYTWGSAIGLGLDLTLRQRFPGTTLDSLMQALWRHYGLPERPYTNDDIERVLGELVGDAAFARDFFDRYVRGRDVVDYAALLAPAGFLVRPARPGAPWLGAPLAEVDGALVVSGYPTLGGPAYAAGLTAGAVVERIGPLEAPTLEAVETLLAARRPGEALPVTFTQRGQRRTATLTLAPHPALEVVPFEAVGRPLTDAQRAFRAAWLGSRAATR